MGGGGGGAVREVRFIESVFWDGDAITAAHVGVKESAHRTHNRGVIESSVHLGDIAIFRDNYRTPECFFFSKGGVGSVSIVEEGKEVVCLPEGVLMDFFLVEGKE